MNYISCTSRLLDKNLRVDSKYIFKLSLSEVKSFIEEKSVDVNTVFIYETSTGRLAIITLLSTAVMTKDEDLVNYLLSKSANVNLGTDLTGMSPIRCALMNKTWRIFLKLLDSGATLEDSRILNSPSLLQIAVEIGNLQAVKYLIDVGANINAKFNNSTVLEAAVARGHLQIVKALMKNGADVDAKGTDVILGQGLAKAILRGQEKRRDFYLECGAHINYRMGNLRGNKSILLQVVRSGNLEMLKFLLNFNEVDINATTDENHSVLSVALAQNQPVDPRIVYKLLNAGIDINIKSWDGKLALHCVNECNNSLYLRLGKHIVMRVTAGLHVCPRNARAVSCDSWNFIRDRCRQEVGLLKNTKLANRVTYYDVLWMPIQRLAVFLKYFDVSATLSFNFIKMFPVYGEMIYYRLIKILQRIQILGERNILDSILPDTINREIHYYLDNHDLVKLIG